MRAYRVVDWSIHFENNRTRELKTMLWVPIPNRFDGDGYTELLEHPEGPAHFGAWVILLEVASKCDPRGTLVRRGRGGQPCPHDADSISRITRFPAEILRTAIARLSEIGWIEYVSIGNEELAEVSRDPATEPQDVASLRGRAPARAQNGMEGNGRERKGTEGKDSAREPAALEEFDSQAGDTFAELWSLWPRKTHMPNAQHAFIAAASRLPKAQELLSSVRLWLNSEDWQDEGGKFVPRLDKWIDRGGWSERPRKPSNRSASMPSFGATSTPADPSDSAELLRSCLIDLLDSPGLEAEERERVRAALSGTFSSPADVLEALARAGFRYADDRIERRRTA